MLTLDVLGVGYFYHLAYYVGVFCCNVVILVQVVGKVVEMGNASLRYHLPIAHTHRYLVGLLKLPIEEFVLLLPRLIKQRRRKRDSVEIILLKRRSGCGCGNREFAQTQNYTLASQGVTVTERCVN